MIMHLSQRWLWYYALTLICNHKTNITNEFLVSNLCRKVQLHKILILVCLYHNMICHMFQWKNPIWMLLIWITFIALTLTSQTWIWPHKETQIDGAIDVKDETTHTPEQQQLIVCRLPIYGKSWFLTFFSQKWPWHLYYTLTLTSNHKINITNEFLVSSLYRKVLLHNILSLLIKKSYTWIMLISGNYANS